MSTTEAKLATCTVCPHPWESHDRIGVRFCTATAAGGLLGRGCVCAGNLTPRSDDNQSRKSYGR